LLPKTPKPLFNIVQIQIKNKCHGCRTIVRMK